MPHINVSHVQVLGVSEFQQIVWLSESKPSSGIRTLVAEHAFITYSTSTEHQQCLCSPKVLINEDNGTEVTPDKIMDQMTMY